MAVRHVVLFKFKAEVDAARVAELVAAFVALKDTIDVVEALEWGTDMSPEGLQDGFTHCFYLTFADAAARDAYLPHPVHQAFVEQLRPCLEKALVIDYVPGV